MYIFSHDYCICRLMNSNGWTDLESINASEIVFFFQRAPLTSISQNKKVIPLSGNLEAKSVKPGTQFRKLGTHFGKPGTRFGNMF